MGKFLNTKGLKDIHVFLEHSLKEVESEVIYQLSYIGEKAVAFAREAHPNNWEDHTGNLRSSIGYVILKDGKPIKQTDTKQYSGPDGDGNEGAATVAPLLAKLAGNYPQGIVLILCAGMEYAEFVEKKGRDVLTGARLLAESLTRKLLRGL